MAEEETETEEVEEQEFDAARAREALRKKNQENAALRKRLKEAEDKGAQLDEIENANKSEVEKLRDERDAAKRDALEAIARADRLEVAITKALPEGDAKHVVNGAKRIVGATREELEADADDYFASFKPQEGANDDTGKPPVSGKPTERLRGGGDPTSEPEETNPAKLAEAVPRDF